jgi:hypothetical protein
MFRKILSCCMLHVKVLQIHFLVCIVSSTNLLFDLELTLGFMLVLQEKKEEMNQREVKYLYLIQVNSLEKSNYIGG